MYYKNQTHQRIFEDWITRSPYKCSNKYLAALYLLTADRELWRTVKWDVQRKSINFSLICPKRVSINSYTIFAVAKDIYNGETHITIKDVCDRQLVLDKMFDLFVTAIHICRFGYSYIGINKVFN